MSRGRRFDEPKLNLKKVFGVVIVLAVMVMVIVSIARLIKNHQDTKQLIALTYLPMLENNKWGVIDNEGNTIIQPTYDEMVIIPDNQKALFVCTYDYNKESGEYKTKVIDENNNELFSGYDVVEPINNYDGKGKIWYENDVLRIKKDRKIWFNKL